jgi:hypothetical protein
MVLYWVRSSKVLKKDSLRFFVAGGAGVKDAAGRENAVDILIEDLDFISLEELPEPGAYHEIERAAGIILRHKRVAADELELAHAKRGHPLLSDLQKLGIQVHSVVMDAGFQILGLPIESFTELRDIPWNPAWDGEDANGCGSGNFASDLPEFVLTAFITAMERLRRRHGEEQRVNPAAERAAAGGLIAVDMIGEAVASRI